MNDDDIGAVEEIGKKKRMGVFVMKPDALIFRLLYSTKFLTDQQAHCAAYFEMTAKSSKQRITKLIDAGYITSISKGLSPASQDEVTSYSSGFDAPIPRGMQDLPAGGSRRIQNQTTRILYLAAGGEEFLRTNMPSEYRFRNPVKPSPYENWTHELSIAKLLVDQLEGSVSERLNQVEKKWNWLTSHRGFNEDGQSNLAISTLASELQHLIPDSVVTHVGTPQRLFIEYDRGTKQIYRQKGALKYKDSVRANLEAYDRFFSMYYSRVFNDKRPVKVLYVVQDGARRNAILELAKNEFGHLPLRVRVTDSVPKFLRHWADDDEDYRTKGTPKEPAKTITPLEAALALIQKHELRINKLEAGDAQKDVLLEQASDHFRRFREAELLKVTPEWAAWLDKDKK